MQTPIRSLVETLDSRLHFLPDMSVRHGRETLWLHSDEVRSRMLHYGAWVNFWGVSCLLVTLGLPLLILLPVLHRELAVSELSVLRFLLCFPALMLGVKYAGDMFICLAANVVHRFAPGAGCSHPPRPWRFRELREAYAWYCGVPRYWVRRANRSLFLLAALGVCVSCYL